MSLGLPGCDGPASPNPGGIGRRLVAARHRPVRRDRARRRGPPVREPRTAGRARLRRDLLRARRVLVRHRHPGRVRDHRPRQPCPSAAREVADRGGHRPLRLRPVRLARRRRRCSGRRPSPSSTRWACGCCGRSRPRSPPRSERRPRPDCWRSTSSTSCTRGSGCSTRSSPSSSSAPCSRVVLDRDRRRDRTDAPWWWRLTLGRPWRLVAGICLGAAAAVKWSGAYVAPAVIGLVVAWEIAERRRRGAGGRMGGVGRRRVPAGGAADGRPAGDRAAARVRRQLHRSDAGRADGAAVGRGIGLARHLGAPARDARLPHRAVAATTRTSRRRGRGR